MSFKYLPYLYYNMSEAARIINIKGYGRTNLFKFLRNNGILDGDNQPLKDYVDLQYFRPVGRKIGVSPYRIHTHPSCEISDRGIEYIRLLILNQNK